MQFQAFFECLSAQRPEPVVEVDLLAELVNVHHFGVGRLAFKVFVDFPGAQMGHFVWLDEDRSSPYEEAFNDAIVFINSRYMADIPMRRIIAAKELMHVFDDAEQRSNEAEKFRTLLNEIAASPMAQDASPQYNADRVALWKAIVCLVPPWIRDQHKQSWADQTVRGAELAARLWLPESIVSAAMGDYYDRALTQFLK